VPTRAPRGGIKNDARAPRGPREYDSPRFTFADAITLGRFLLDSPGSDPAAKGSDRDYVQRVLHANLGHPFALHVKEAFDSCRFYVGWAMAWARSGCQRVAVGHKLAASLMATHADDAEAMTCSPWDAYLVEVPAEVACVMIRGQRAAFDAIGVWHPDTKDERSIVVLGRDTHAIITGQVTFPLPELGDFTHGALDLEDHEVLARVREAMARLVIGVELEMTDPARVKRPAASKHPKASSTAPSGIHRLLREVRVDCRAVMASYLSGERGTSPSVQTLVRGHYQRVAVGPGRLERRWIHREPFWRGPEDAPQAVHVHRVGEREKS
jgi:hypothetical protein